MPRNRPGALRGAHPNARPERSQCFPEPIRGLSSATSLAILRVEQEIGDYYVFVDVVHARDVLEQVLKRLPVRARAELGRVVRRLDIEFERRTLPNPHAWNPFWNNIDVPAERPDPWWYDRFPGGRWSESP
ncbi:hypothetical protein ABZX92_06215 [Lentzea sp. NPDC006480]|uniref:hypothetical protein n=1 Tax=Lentzea sp. NPDC006480 TaxID=3157176 RepID=UPI00339E1910